MAFDEDSIGAFADMTRQVLKRLGEIDDSLLEIGNALRRIADVMERREQAELERAVEETE